MKHKLFKVIPSYDGEDWLIAFGTDWDGNEYAVTTDHIHASELSDISGGAKLDAELVCKLLNAYYGYFLDRRDFDALQSGRAIEGNDERALFAAAIAAMEMSE